MKLLPPLGCLFAGVAIGWFAKPAPSGSGNGPVTALTAPSASPSSALGIPEKYKSGEESTSGSSVRPPRPAIDTSKREIEAKVGDLEKDMQKQMAQKMTDLQRKKFEARFAKLCAQLNLSPDQQAKIRAVMEERFTKMGELFTFDGSDDNAARMKELSTLMKGDALDDATAALLNDEQRTGFDALKGKERQSRIDSKALKDLGSLGTVLDLSQDQKDAVYAVLSEQAAKQEDSKKSTAMMGMFTEGMGIQIDDEIGIQDILQEQMESHVDGPPAAGMMKTIEETIKKRTDERVEALRPVLNDQQLQQYRAHLETKAAGMMTMFGGVESSETVPIPVE